MERYVSTLLQENPSVANLQTNAEAVTTWSKYVEGEKEVNTNKPPDAKVEIDKLDLCSLFDTTGKHN